MVARYQEVSLRAELETTATLLAAAGIRARIVLPSEALPDRLDNAARAKLRREVASLLGTERAGSTVAIRVVRDDQRVQVELRAGNADPAATGVRTA
jgi:hypothetical protein